MLTESQPSPGPRSSETATAGGRNNAAAYHLTQIPEDASEETITFDLRDFKYSPLVMTMTKGEAAYLRRALDGLADRGVIADQ